MIVFFSCVAGVAVNTKNNYNQTPLLCAVEENDFNLVSLLIDAGADLNAQDYNGQTALHCSVSRNQEG